MIRQLILKLNLSNKKNFLIYGVGQAFNLLSPLIVAPYIIRICKVDGFGKVGLGFALSLFLILIVDYAFDIKGTKEVSENRANTNKLQRIISNTLYTKAILFFIAISIGLILIFFIPFFKNEKELYLYSLMIVLAQVFNPTWFLQGLEDFKWAAIVNIASKTVYLILVFNFIVYKEDYFLVNFFLGISAFICNLVGLFILKNRYGFIIPKPNFNTIKGIIKKDFFFCVSQLFLSIRQLSPLLLISYFLGFSLAGQYKIVEQVITLYRTFIQVYLKYFFPRVCYEIKQNFDSGFAFWKKYVTINLVLVTGSLLIIYILSGQILHFFNVSTANILYLESVFKLVLIVPFLMVLSLSLEQLMFITNKNKKYIQYTIFVTILNVLLILLLLFYFSLKGVIIAIALSEITFILLYFNKAFPDLNKKLIN